MTNPGSGSAVLRAATEGEGPVIEAEQRHHRTQADQARLHWAARLHRQGYCDAAGTVLRQAWDGSRIGQRQGFVVAAILYIRLLRQCQREDEAGALWAEIQADATPSMRRKALSFLLIPALSELHEIDNRAHARVCGYRRRTGS